jgi:hypothetical protein
MGIEYWVLSIGLGDETLQTLRILCGLCDYYFKRKERKGFAMGAMIYD